LLRRAGAGAPAGTGELSAQAGPGTGPEHANGRYATAQEVRAALDGLTNLDHARLRGMAWHLLEGTGLSQPQDLLLEAFDSVLLGAQSGAAGERAGRAWRIKVPFLAHLHLTLKDVARDAHCAREHAVRVPGEDRHGERQVSLDSPTAVLIAAQPVAELMRDDELRAILEGQADGLTPAQIQQRNNMTEREYQNAERRLWRLCQKVRADR
jgi:hypothetical protein